MKKILAVVCVVAMMLSLSIVAGAEEKKAITITTAEELAGMANDLTADYILDADIDLAGITWNPIGTYKPSGESEEEQEIPASDAAFAYWLAAGIPADRDEQMVQNVIELFCTENLAEMSEEAAA